MRKEPSLCFTSSVPLNCINTYTLYLYHIPCWYLLF